MWTKAQTNAWWSSLNRLNNPLEQSKHLLDKTLKNSLLTPPQSNPKFHTQYITIQLIYKYYRSYA